MSEEDTPPGLRLRLSAAVVAWIVRALGSTWRLRIVGDNPLEGEVPGVGALWHRGIIVAAYAFRGSRLAIPISQSKDGDLGARVVELLGFAEPVRGSTSSHARALLLAAVRRARAGESVAFLPDGPRGPAGVAQPGVVALARLAQRRIHPVTVHAYPAYTLPSWDGTVIPLPFARVEVRFGAPIEVPPRANRDQLGAALAELTRALDAPATGSAGG